jgi:hypothetical protein
VEEVSFAWELYAFIVKEIH